MSPDNTPHKKRVLYTHSVPPNSCSFTRPGVWLPHFVKLLVISWRPHPRESFPRGVNSFVPVGRGFFPRRDAQSVFLHRVGEPIFPEDRVCPYRTAPPVVFPHRTPKFPPGFPRGRPQGMSLRGVHLLLRRGGLAACWLFSHGSPPRDPLFCPAACVSVGFPLVVLSSSRYTWAPKAVAPCWPENPRWCFLARVWPPRAPKCFQRAWWVFARPRVSWECF